MASPTPPWPKHGPASYSPSIEAEYGTGPCAAYGDLGHSGVAACRVSLD